MVKMQSFVILKVSHWGKTSVACWMRRPQLFFFSCRRRHTRYWRDWSSDVCSSDLAGHPRYEITKGTLLLDGENVLAMTVDERARAGLFLAMQYPVEVPGVSVSNFLRTAKTAIDGEAPKLRTWVKDVNATLDRLNLDSTFGMRSVNEGFSGGEKKRHEIAQMELLDPGMAILDETDSGLDIDALKIVSEGVNRFRAQEGKAVLLITHYTRILRYIQPDFVHVFVAGRIADQGGPELAEELEANGYDKYVKAAVTAG